MAITIDKPATKSTNELPAVVEEFLRKSIEKMDENQLKTWKRQSASIMRKAKRRASAEKASSATQVGAQPAARKMRSA